jgi:hypothetical protein
MRRGQVAEPAGEVGLRIVVEMILPAEEDHFVLVQGRSDHLQDGYGQVRAYPHADDLCSDVPRDAVYIEMALGHGGSS